MTEMPSLRDVAVLALLRLRPTEWQKTLALAGLIGVPGAPQCGDRRRAESSYSGLRQASRQAQHP